MIDTYVISDQTNKLLSNTLLNIWVNPYRDYKKFKSKIKDIICNNQLPEELVNLLAEIKDKRKNYINSAFLLKNCPIDKNIKPFNHIDPVQDKYNSKITFIGEGFLEIFSQITDEPLLAYDTRNNGDFFHDVYAHDTYQNTQTQKSDSELHFHNDRTAHPVRADFLSLLGMRASSINTILTHYIDGHDVLNFLTESEKDILRKPYFYTPYDEYSRASNSNQINSHPHAILSESSSLRYYETRTRPLKNMSPEIYEAYVSFRDAIIKAKRSAIDIQEGDLFSFPNQFGLHNRSFIEIKDKVASKDRWLLKTYSFRNTDYMHKFSLSFKQDIPGFVFDQLAETHYKEIVNV